MADSELTLTNESTTRHRRIEFHLARKPSSLTGINNGDFHLETLNPSATNLIKAVVNRDSLSLKKPEGLSEVLENGLDPELFFGITFRRIGAGLKNLGNTCFLNSVLQCLTYTEPLAAYLQSGKHQVSCRVAGFCALCAIQKHVSRALQSSGRILAPNDLVSNLRCISRNFRNARQEDAHEYMVNLLESMHKCCLPKGVPSESPGAYEKSLVHKIFGGRLRSQVRCMQCNYCSDTYDPFLDLSLEIAKADSLIKALANFTAREQLDGGAKHYQCQHCKQKVKALKQLSVYKAPYVLTIHLKRFHAHEPGKKIDKRVQFATTLNLKPFFTGSYVGDLTYTLYGVLVHSGWSTHSGHYYCFVRTTSGTWYSVDDNRIHPVGERTVLEQKAYMLFYYRDLRNVVPKKPVHVQKETIPELKIEMISTSEKDIRGAVQDGSMQKVFSGANTSALASMNKPVKERSALSPLRPLVNGAGHYSNTGNASLSSTAVKTDNKNEEGSFSNNLNYTANVQPICKPNQYPATEGVVTDVISKKVNFTSEGRVSSVPQSRENDDNTTDKIDVGTDNQDGNIPIGSASGVLPNGKISTTGLKSVHGQIDPSSTTIMLTEHVSMLAPEQKSRRKVKKKVLKYRPMNLHLGSNLLYGASLNLRKKKKRKHSTIQSLGIHNLTKEDMEENDLGPTTSKKSSRKTDRSCLEDVQNVRTNNTVLNSVGDSLMNVKNEEFKDRLNEHGTVPATEKLPNESLRSNTVTSVSHCDTREPDVTKDVQIKSLQSCIVTTGSRALQEAVVASWDGVELHQPREVELNTRETVSIGYIPDEWDEEYDRGKVKKIRTSKEDFGGPNPFQEIASKKAHLKKTRFKKATMGHSSSGNKPFRI